MLPVTGTHLNFFHFNSPFTVFCFPIILNKTTYNFLSRNNKENYYFPYTNISTVQEDISLKPTLKLQVLRAFRCTSCLKWLSGIITILKLRNNQIEKRNRNGSPTCQKQNHPYSISSQFPQHNLRFIFDVARQVVPM